jgi:hypothetical protein
MVQQASATILAFALSLSLLCALAMVAEVSAQSDCQGNVGAYAYDLRPLAGVGLQATDNTNQVYYYRVCVASSTSCSARL